MRSGYSLQIAYTQLYVYATLPGTTHVAALAERVPVRFLVTRDARTSRVVRESLAHAGAGLTDLAGTE